MLITDEKKVEYRILNTVLAILLAMLVSCTGGNSSYTREEISYFCEIALGFDYNDNVTMLRKWGKNPEIYIEGSPVQNDNETIEFVVSQINALTSGRPSLSISPSGGDIKMVFKKEAELLAEYEEYSAGVSGYFFTEVNSSYEIRSAVILIAVDLANALQREYLIRKELSHSLGLIHSTQSYPDSVFYEGWSLVTKFSGMDEILINMISLKELKPGMNYDQVLLILKRD